MVTCGGLIFCINIQGRFNNNRMERYHGTFKERNKVMRSLKKTDSPIVDGQRIYYNYVRPHQGLESRTPAEKAGIGIEDQNKWLGLIRKASRR